MSSIRPSRVVSVVEASWGQGTVYSDEPEDQAEELQAPIAAISESFSDLQEEEISSPSSENDNYSLPYFQASLFATVLEDTITELRILSNCNTEMRISKTMADMKLLLALKYSVKQPETHDELDGIDHHNLDCIEYKLNKLDADRKYFSDVLLSIYKDLSMNKTYAALSMHVDKIVSLNRYRILTQDDETKNRMKRRELAKQLRQQRNHIKSVTYDTDAIIDELKTQVEDATLNAEIRSRYIENWQRARAEQHHQTIDDEELKPSQVIEYFKQRTDHEQRVHYEVELLVNIAINETLEKVEQWMDKYDKDMEAIDLKIQLKKNEYQDQLKTREGLEETIEKHDKLMKDWIQFKDEREKARQYREKMTNSAITVQAWWRGLLVRRQLGPYKVAKKKGAAGKDKKK